MRPRDLLRVAGVATAVLLLAAPPAGAAMPSGSLTFFPSASIDTAAIKAQTSAGCPEPADSFFAVAKGHGFPAAGQIVTTPTAAGMSRTEGFEVYFAETMKDFAVDNRTTLKGRYDIAVYCVDSFLGTKYAQFTGTLTFATPTKFRASGKDTTKLRPSTAATPETKVTVVPAQPSATAPAGATAAEQAPEADPSSTRLVAEPVTDPGDGPPYGWIAAGVAGILLAFEGGRRFGRRSATTRP